MSFKKNLTVTGGNRNSPKSGIKIPFQGVVKLISQTNRETQSTDMDTETDRRNHRCRIFPTSSSDMEKTEKSEFKPSSLLNSEKLFFS